jgi:exodeoxyribonuclease VII large subunit
MKDFITVSELNEYINSLLSEDLFLRSFWLKGEISGFRLYQQSGHLYFNLKDKDSSVNCVMFKSRARKVNFQLEDGMEVLLRASVSVFARQGRYQVYVEEMQPYGLGGLYLQLEKLKRELDAKGYFNAEKKQAIPEMPSCVGIVTSQDGAALRDILKVIRQRNRGIRILLVHSTVQGEGAARELAEGIRLLNEHAEAELIIIGRGGGSLEDLMAFNSEEVVKAIYESNIPLISAVGHEVDFSLSDLAADLRAATPTQAAQMAVPDIASLKEEIIKSRQGLERAISRKIQYNSELLDRIMMRKVWKESRAMLAQREDILQELIRSLLRAIKDKQKGKEQGLSLLASSLDALSPLKTMQRGYALVRKDSYLLKDGDAVEIGDELQLSLWNAELEVEVKTKERVKR